MTDMFLLLLLCKWICLCNLLDILKFRKNPLQFVYLLGNTCEKRQIWEICRESCESPNPLHSFSKWSDTLWKSCRIWCSIFNACLTILWTLDTIRLNRFIYTKGTDQNISDHFGCCYDLTRAAAILW